MKKRRLFVGGLPWSVDDADLKALFEDGDTDSGAEGCGSGTVEEATVIRDRETGKSKGFAFVEMADSESIEKALKLNGLNFKGRSLKVDIAADKSDSFDRRGGDRPSFRGGNDRFSNSGFPPKKRREY